MRCDVGKATKRLENEQRNIGLPSLLLQLSLLPFSVGPSIHLLNCFLSWSSLLTACISFPLFLATSLTYCSHSFLGNIFPISSTISLSFPVNVVLFSLSRLLVSRPVFHYVCLWITLFKVSKWLAWSTRVWCLASSLASLDVPEDGLVISYQFHWLWLYRQYSVIGLPTYIKYRAIPPVTESHLDHNFSSFYYLLRYIWSNISLNASQTTTMIWDDAIETIVT